MFQARNTKSAVPYQKKTLHTHLKTKIFTIKKKPRTHLLLSSLPHPKPFYFSILTNMSLYFTVGMISFIAGELRESVESEYYSA